MKIMNKDLVITLLGKCDAFTLYQCYCIDDWKEYVHIAIKKVKPDFDEIAETQQLPEEFINDFADELDWYLISEYQKLSEKCMRRNKTKLKWKLISENQNLNEKFIEEFQDKVYWNYILQHQTLTEKFLMKHIDRVKEYLDSGDRSWDQMTHYRGNEGSYYLYNDEAKQNRIKYYEYCVDKKRYSHTLTYTKEIDQLLGK